LTPPLRRAESGIPDRRSPDSRAVRAGAAARPASIASALTGLEVRMAKYVVLANFTDQGIRNVGDTVARAEQVKAAMAAAGVKMLDILWTLGQHDLVLTVEAPDDETATRVLLKVAKAGNVRSTTLRAFTAQDMGRILQGV